MLRTREAEHRVIYSNEELRIQPFESASQGRLTDVFDDVVAYESPKLARRNPDAAFVADYFR